MFPNATSCGRISVPGVLTEKISALERFDALGVIPMEGDRVDWSAAEDVDRRMRTRKVRPLASTSDSVTMGSRPSSDITSLSSSNLDMEAATVPGNWFWMRRVAALYSKRKSKSVYLRRRPLVNWHALDLIKKGTNRKRGQKLDSTRINLCI